MNPLFNRFFREYLIRALMARFSSVDMDMVVRAFNIKPSEIVLNPPTLLDKAMAIVDYFGDMGRENDLCDVMIRERPFLAEDTFENRKKVVATLSQRPREYRDDLTVLLGENPENVKLEPASAEDHAWASC